MAEAPSAALAPLPVSEPDDSHAPDEVPASGVASANEDSPIPDESPASELVANEGFGLLNPVDMLDQPTSRPSGGRTGRHIDYGLASRGLCATARQQ